MWGSLSLIIFCGLLLAHRNSHSCLNRGKVGCFPFASFSLMSWIRWKQWKCRKQRPISSWFYMLVSDKLVTASTTTSMLMTPNFLSLGAISFLNSQHSQYLSISNCLMCISFQTAQISREFTIFLSKPAALLNSHHSPRYLEFWCFPFSPSPKPRREKH